MHHIGYGGPVVFESFSAVVSAQLSRTLAIWRDLWQDSDELGAHALAFIRDRFTANRSLTHH